ncbi:WD40 repeat domain-containing protein [Actinoplanes sp. CA-030573]|uniref:WD40 repeat domain-containing protein n=1 Tax=Actinoplanes sp. CA-030573 TaxID=3239898 RepID=UPI003D9009C1
MPTRHGPIAAVALRDGARRLVSCSRDATAVVWDTEHPARPSAIAVLPHPAAVTGAAWNPVAADLLVTAGGDGTATVWRIVGDRPVQRYRNLRGHGGGLIAVEWLPDGRHLLGHGDDGRLVVWNATTGERLRELRDCARFAVSADGRLAVVRRDGLVTAGETTGDLQSIGRRPAKGVQACAWSPDGSTLALAREDGIVELCSPTLEPVRTVRTGQAALRTVAWSPDGAILVVGSYTRSVQAFDTDSNQRWSHTDATMWPASLAVRGDAVAVGSLGSGPGSSSSPPAGPTSHRRTAGTGRPPSWPGTTPSSSAAPRDWCCPSPAKTSSRPARSPGRPVPSCRWPPTTRPSIAAPPPVS